MTSKDIALSNSGRSDENAAIVTTVRRPIALSLCAAALLATLGAGCSSSTQPPPAPAATAYWAGPKKLPPALQLAESNTYASLKPQVPAGMNATTSVPPAQGREEYEAFVSGGK